MDTDPFLQPDGETLKNRLGIENDPEALKFAERELSSDRLLTLAEEVAGNFDAEHLRAIHHHLFQDLYEWAGTLRCDTITLEGERIDVPAELPTLSKGSTEFLPSAYVERGLAEVARLADRNEARSPDPEIFAEAAGEVFSTLNQVHPFREGNGRTQRCFVEQLAARAGHTLDFEGVTTERMVEASVEAVQGDTEALKRIIAESLDPARVELRLVAVAALERTGIEADEFWVEAAAAGDHVRGMCLGRHEDHVTVATEENRFIVIVPDALPDARQGDMVDFRYEEPQPGVRREASADASAGLFEAAREAWADIQAMDSGAERARLEREYVEACRDLPAGVREEILRELPDRLVGRSREDERDLGL